MPPRALLLASGDIALPLLEFLCECPEVNLTGLFCQPDRPAGRKRTLTPVPAKTLALKRGIPVFQPERLRRETALLKSLEPELIIVMAYGQILSQEVLDLPRLGCWNLHASLLPRHRGAAPVQAAILAGDDESGVTVMKMDAGLDTGAVLSRETLPLSPEETGESLHDRLAVLAPEALRKALPLILSGDPPLTPQDDSLATHTGKLTRRDGVLDWTLPAAVLERKIRAFHPWPGTGSALPDGTPVKIFPPARALTEPADGAPPGTLLRAGPEALLFATGEGVLAVSEIQLPGARRMSVAEHLRGHFRKPGEIWGAASGG